MKGVIKVDIQALKSEYNRVLQRFNKAAAYLDNPKVPNSSKEKWIPEFKAIVQRLDDIIGQIEAAGLMMDGKQILKGFEEA